MNEDQILELFTFLQNEGWNVGQYNDFKGTLSDETARKQMYDFFTGEGYNLGDVNALTPLNPVTTPSVNTPKAPQKPGTVENLDEVLWKVPTPIKQKQEYTTKEAKAVLGEGFMGQFVPTDETTEYRLAEKFFADFPEPIKEATAQYFTSIDPKRKLYYDTKQNLTEKEKAEIAEAALLQKSKTAQADVAVLMDRVQKDPAKQKELQSLQTIYNTEVTPENAEQIRELSAQVDPEGEAAQLLTKIGEAEGYADQYKAVLKEFPEEGLRRAKIKEQQASLLAEPGDTWLDRANKQTVWAVSNAANSFLKAGVGLVKSTKTLADAIRGGETDAYTASDAVVEGLENFVDDYLKFQTPPAQIFKDGNYNGEAVIPGITTMLTDMAILLSGTATGAKLLGKSTSVAGKLSKELLATVPTSMALTFSDYYDTAKGEGLNDADAREAAGALSFANGLLEVISPNRVIRGLTPISVKGLIKAIDAGDLTAGKAIGFILKENSKELAQEYAQMASDKVIGGMYNQAHERDIFDDEFNLDEIKETALLTIAATTLIGAPAVSANWNDVQKGAAEELKSRMKTFGEQLNRMIENKEITYDKAQQLYSSVEKFNPEKDRAFKLISTDAEEFIENATESTSKEEKPATRRKQRPYSLYKFADAAPEGYETVEIDGETYHKIPDNVSISPSYPHKKMKTVDGAVGTTVEYDGKTGKLRKRGDKFFVDTGEEKIPVPAKPGDLWSDVAEPTQEQPVPEVEEKKAALVEAIQNTKPAKKAPAEKAPGTPAKSLLGKKVTTPDGKVGILRKLNDKQFYLKTPDGTIKFDEGKTTVEELGLTEAVKKPSVVEQLKQKTEELKKETPVQEAPVAEEEVVKKEPAKKKLKSAPEPPPIIQGNVLVSPKQLGNFKGEIQGEDIDYKALKEGDGVEYGGRSFKVYARKKDGSLKLWSPERNEWVDGATKSEITKTGEYVQVQKEEVSNDSEETSGITFYDVEPYTEFTKEVDSAFLSAKTKDEAKALFKKLAIKYHPDKGVYPVEYMQYIVRMMDNWGKKENIVDIFAGMTDDEWLDWFITQLTRPKPPSEAEKERRRKEGEAIRERSRKSLLHDMAGLFRISDSQAIPVDQVLEAVDLGYIRARDFLKRHPFGKTILNAVPNSAWEKHFKLEVVDNLNGANAAVGILEDGTISNIKINRGTTLDLAALTDVVVHEIIHKLTFSLLTGKPEDASAIGFPKNFFIKNRNKLEKVFEEAKAQYKGGNKKVEYALSNIYEFAANFANNKEFVRFLEDLDSKVEVKVQKEEWVGKRKEYFEWLLEALNDFFAAIFSGREYKAPPREKRVRNTYYETQFENKKGELFKEYKEALYNLAQTYSYTDTYVREFLLTKVNTGDMRGRVFGDEGDLAYHGGNLKEKSDYLESGYSGDNPWTGYYFFGERQQAEQRGNRKTKEKEVSIVDFSKYNLYKPTTGEYWRAKEGLKDFVVHLNRGNAPEDFDFSKIPSNLPVKDILPQIKDAFKPWSEQEVSGYPDYKKKERFETVIMKLLGFEGIDVRGLKESGGLASPDTSKDGSVIFDLKKGTVKPTEQVDLTKELSDSKIVNKDGSLKIVYRSQKDTRKQTEVRQADHYGIYFSENKDSTKIYGDKTGQYVLNIKNPLILKDKEWNLSVIPKYLYDNLISKGYDGAIWERNGEMYEIVAFNSEQVFPVNNDTQKTTLEEPKVELNKGVFTSKPVDSVIAVHEKYTGKPLPERRNITLDTQQSMQIADEYEKMEHNPTDPEVQKAYKKMATETVAQYDALVEAGFSFEIFDGKGEPYKSSSEMMDDLRENKHIFILSTKKEFGTSDFDPKNNPLLEDSGRKDINGVELLINDVFRGVHDVFGHSLWGNSFGPIGEEIAWEIHSDMYSPLSRRAMTTETRGQNSWVNFGAHLRRDGKVPKKGEPGYVPLTERPFADQKTGLLPEWVSSSKTNIEIARENLRQAWRNFNTFGAIYDPEVELEKQRQLWKALFEYAGAWLKDKVNPRYYDFKRTLPDDLEFPEEGIRAAFNQDKNYEQKIEKQAPKTRKSAKRFLAVENQPEYLKDSIKRDGLRYFSVPMYVTDAAAEAYLEEFGPEKAAEMILNASGEMPMDVEILLGMKVRNILANMAKKANTKAEEARLYALADAVMNHNSKKGTLLGRAINIFKEWASSDPKGVVLWTNRLASNMRERLASRYRVPLEKAMVTVEQINKEAADAVIFPEELTTFGYTKEDIRKKKAEAKKRLVDKLRSTASAVGPLNALPEIVEYGFFVFLDGANTFQRWANEMRKVGVNDKDLLKDVWENQQSPLNRPLATASVQEDIRDALGTAGLESVLRSYGVRNPGQVAAQLNKRYAEKLKSVARTKFNAVSKQDKVNKAILKAAESGERITRDMLDRAFTENDVTLTPEIEAEILAMAEQLQETKEGFKKDELAIRMVTMIHQNTGGERFSDTPTALYYGSMLSAPATHVANAFGSLYNLLFDKIPLTLTQAALTPGIPRRKVVTDMLIGIKEGFVRGMMEANNVFLTGIPAKKESTKYHKELGALEKYTWDYLKKRGFKWGDLIALIGAHPLWMKYVPRTLGATDAFFYQVFNEFYKPYAAAIVAKETGQPYEAVYRPMSRVAAVQQAWSEISTAPLTPDLEAKALAGKLDPKVPGWSRRDFNRRIREIEDQARDAYDIRIEQEANEFASRGTFNYKPEGVLGVFANMIDTGAHHFLPLRLVVPFTNIVANVVNEQLDWTPIGILRATGYKNPVYGGSVLQQLQKITSGGVSPTTAPKTEAEYQRMLMRGVIGSFMMVGLAAWVLGSLDDEEDFITVHGKGPGDYKQNKQWRADGNMPYSIRIGDKFFSYQYSPQGFLLTIIGNMADAYRYDRDQIFDEAGNVIGYEGGDALSLAAFRDAVAAAPGAILNMAFLKGVADILDALKDATETGDTKPLERFMIRVGTTPFPNFFRAMEKAVLKAYGEPTEFETGSTTENILQSIPIYGRIGREILDIEGKQKLDMWGRPVERSTTAVGVVTGIGRIFKPQIENSEIIDFLERKNIFPTEPGRRKMTDGPMDDDEYYTFKKLSGKALEKDLTAYLPQMQNMSQEKLEKFVKTRTGIVRTKIQNMLKSGRTEEQTMQMLGL